MCIPIICNVLFFVIVFQNLVVSQTLTAGIILVCGWLYFSMFLPKGGSQLSQLGLTCSVFTVSMYLSPLSSLVRSSARSEEAVRDFIRTHRMFILWYCKFSTIKSKIHQINKIRWPKVSVTCRMRQMLVMKEGEVTHLSVNGSFSNCTKDCIKSKAEKSVLDVHYTFQKASFAFWHNTYHSVRS